MTVHVCTVYDLCQDNQLSVTNRNTDEPLQTFKKKQHMYNLFMQWMWGTYHHFSSHCYFEEISVGAKQLVFSLAASK